MPLTETEIRALGYLQSSRRASIQTGELREVLDLDDRRERKLLSRLSRRKWIARVRRGLYLVPPGIPAGGMWSPSVALALTSLMEDCNGRYQISGPTAFTRYGWDQQVPSVVFVYNDRYSGSRRIGANQFMLVKVSDVRLGSTVSINTPEGIELVYSSRQRALLDAVYDWSRFDTLPRAYDWIRRELSERPEMAADLVSVTLEYGNQGTIRRMGRLLESLDAPAGLLRNLERALRTTSSYIPWVPVRPKRGPRDPRWKVVVNDG
jgi:predicted transcriptional regulator of viral defense system